MKSQLNHIVPRSGTKRAAIVATEIKYMFIELFTEFGIQAEQDPYNEKRVIYVLESRFGRLEFSMWESDFTYPTASGGFFLFSRFTGTDEQVEAASKVAGNSLNGKWNHYVKCSTDGVDSVMWYLRNRLPRLVPVDSPKAL